MAKYYYNDVLLPKIPQDVLTEYPYCWIRKNKDTGNYDLAVGKKPWYYYMGVFTCDDGSANRPWYVVSINESENVTEWTFKEMVMYNYFGIDSTRTALWSNHNIPNGSETSTSIYYYGSEPVPEFPEEPEPDEPDFEPEHSTKYLIKSEDMLCTVIDNELVLLDATELTAEFLHNHGFDELPDWSVISTLTNPEILYWQSADIEDELPTITATMTATPYPQTVISPNYSMTDDTILGVECAYVTASSDVVFAISVDDGATWYMWTGEAWGSLTDATTGMTAETVNAITTEQWAGLMTTGQFKVRMTLFDENSSFTSFVMDYIN